MNRIYLLLISLLLGTGIASATSITMTFKSNAGAEPTPITTETKVTDFIDPDPSSFITAVSSASNVSLSSEGLLFSGGGSLELKLKTSKRILQYVLVCSSSQGEDANVTINNHTQLVSGNNTELIFEESDEAQKASIAITSSGQCYIKSLTVVYINPNELMFPEEEYYVDLDKKDSFTAPTLFIGGTRIKNITYKSLNDNVAQVDASTGKVSIKTWGSVPITATGTFAQSEVSASYILYVVPPTVAPGETETAYWHLFDFNKGDQIGKTLKDTPIDNVNGNYFGVWYIDGEFKERVEYSCHGSGEDRKIWWGTYLTNSFNGTLTLKNSRIPENAQIKSISIKGKEYYDATSFNITASVNGTEVVNSAEAFTWNSTDTITKKVAVENLVGNDIVLKISSDYGGICLYSVAIDYVVPVPASPSAPTVNYLSDIKDATTDHVNLTGFGQKVGDYFKLEVLYNESDNEVLNYSTTCYSTTLNDVVIEGTVPNAKPAAVRANKVQGVKDSGELNEPVAGTVTSGAAKFGVASNGTMIFYITKDGVTSPAVSIVFEGKTTGVESIAVDAETETAPQYYNLQGMRIAFPTSGVYIVREGNRITKRIVR